MKSLVFFSACILIMLNSCLPEKTEYWFNEDSSGELAVTIDMGEMAGAMVDMMESLGEEMTEGEMEFSDEGSESIDIWKKEENMDSVMVIYEIMPDSIKEKLANPEVLKKVMMHVKIDSEKEYAKMKISIQYDNNQELEQIISMLEESQSKDEMAMGGDDNEITDMFGEFTHDSAKSVIYIKGVDAEESAEDPELQEMLAELKDPANSENPQFMEMMKMFLGGETETIVHAPGKIISTNIEDAIIEGSTVTFKDNIMEVLMSGKSTHKYINYEK